MDYMKILTIVSAVIAGASVALHAIAPLTKNVTDDRLLAALHWIENALGKLSLNKKA